CYNLLSGSDRFSIIKMEEHVIATSYGIPLHVYMQRGTKTSGSILTFHDIGTNYRSFLGFFNYCDMQVIADNFNVYHVCAPGHQDNAGPVASDGVEEKEGLLTERQQFATYADGVPGKIGYPSLDEIADMLQSVVAHFNLAYFVGFGSGAGSNVLCRYALKHPDKVLSLFLINPNANTDNTYYNWLFANNNAEWQRMSQGLLTDSALKLLERHWFGHNSSDCYDSIEACKQQLLSMCLPNVAGYIKAYNDRPDLGIQRDLAKQPGSGLRTLEVQAFLVTGGLAKDMVTRLVAMNSRCDPGRTEFLIVDESDGMMMETEPAKLAVLFLRHLRSCGLVVSLTPERVRELAKQRCAAASVAAADVEAIDETADIDCGDL
ncbi:hypothetical protein BOX15_Mlig002036g1, partial [Macrostomum lignano]